MTNTSRETIEINGIDMPVDDFMYSDHLVVNHDLNIMVGSEIYRLPDNLQVNGQLHINSDNISYLPENLVVNGSLMIVATNITRFPETMVVSGIISLCKTKIDYIPAQKDRVYIMCLENTVPVKLADNMTCGIVIFINTKVEELPSGLSALSLTLEAANGYPFTDMLCLPNDLSVNRLSVCSSLEAQPIPRKIKKIEFTDIHYRDDLYHDPFVKINYTFGFESSDTLVINGTPVSYDNLKKMTMDDVITLLLGETGKNHMLNWQKKYKYQTETFWKKWRDEIIRHGETIAENA